MTIDNGSSQPVSGQGATGDALPPEAAVPEPCEKGQAMEIHPPERPVHSVKDFLLQLMTITAGILIALSLETVVAGLHHRALVTEARAKLAEELRDNRREVAEFLKNLPTYREADARVLAFIDSFLTSKPVKGKFDFESHYAVMTLSSTSWNTAQTTGAVGYMEYEDVQKYASAYTLQGRVERLQDRVLDSYISGFMPVVDPDKASERELVAWRQTVQAIAGYLEGERQLAEGLMKEYDKILK